MASIANPTPTSNLREPLKSPNREFRFVGISSALVCPREARLE